ncbi:hypothetical protein N802_07145 [Knoellia sinensis KCTC 19936]|uniref:TIGR03118 family protein n=1 Tax=Knoellia sinensis KCTC 19936 TaxID=1385520 RepID=A0A0A0J012_9MICO|nr:TIGR03118 family protein [Knoellia sinensis]KGN30413.1 hypothetical protein N802_07145 [Knoellia sinensis KCTC 19936]
MNRTVAAASALVLAASLTACSSGSGDAVAVALTSAGCPDLSLPERPLTLRVHNSGGEGGFEVYDSAGASVARLDPVKAGAHADVEVDLGAGHYVLECGPEEATSSLTVGTPSDEPLDLGSAAPADKPAVAGSGTFDTTNLVANSAKYAPQIVDPTMLNAWGLASRPAGKGGHFWVAASGSASSIQYVGDVAGTPLHQDDLRVVTVPGDKVEGFDTLGEPTGVIFNDTTNFVVDQGAVKGPAKFLFATADGTISAWTETAQPGGSVTRPPFATKVADDSADGAQYFGLAISPTGDQLLAADFGTSRIVTFSSTFEEEATKGFNNPFPGFAPFNVTTIDDQVLVSYAKVDEPGEEVHEPGAGRVAAFTADGALVKAFDDQGGLDAPWGIVKAPAGFGGLEGALLVANFGDGTISAFRDGAFVDYVRDADGEPVVVPGIWGLLAGNGASLGDAKAVYFSAGPRGEQDGIFGRIDPK